VDFEVRGLVIEVLVPLGDAGLCPAELGRVGFFRVPENPEAGFFYSSISLWVFCPLGITGFVLLGR